jgi:type IV secretion system protein VirB8
MKKLLEKKEKVKKTVGQVKNWYQDRYETVIIQRNILFLFLIIMMVVFAFTINGIIGLNSKKVYEPFIVQVEDNTGIITKVNNDMIRELSADKALRNSTIVRYILARENYNSADYNYNYNTVVRLFSTPQVFDVFSSQISAQNPNSPLGFGFDFKLETKVKTITDIDEKQKLIQIRVSKAKIAVRSRDGKPEWEKSYIISLKYDFFDAKLSEEERYINPLGLQITDYNISEELNATTF